MNFPIIFSLIKSSATAQAGTVIFRPEKILGEIFLFLCRVTFNGLHCCVVFNGPERARRGGKKKQNKKFSNDQRDLKRIYEGKRLPGSARLLSGVKALRDVLKSKKRQEKPQTKRLRSNKLVLVPWEEVGRGCVRCNGWCAVLTNSALWWEGEWVLRVFFIK